MNSTGPAPPPPLLVLLPGLDGTGRLFKAFIDALPATMESLVVPYAPGAASDYDSIERSISHLIPQDRPVVLLGESFSGPLALRIAAGGGLNLVALVLVASFVRRPVAWLSPMARSVLGAWMFRLPGQRIVLNHLLGGGKASEALIREAMASLHSNGHDVLAGRVRAALGVDATDALLRCPAPILYLRGARDRLIDADTANAFKKLRSDLECRTIQAPHFILQVAPAEAAQAICDFLSRVQPVRLCVNAEHGVR